MYADILRSDTRETLRKIFEDEITKAENIEEDSGWSLLCKERLSD